MVNYRRTIVPFLLLAACFAAVGVRLFYIQVWHHAELNASVQKLIFRERPEQPCRGMVLDSQGRVLAMSVRNYTLFLDTAMIDDMKAVEAGLRKFNIAVPADVRSGARTSSYIPIAKDLDMTTMQGIRALGLRGVGFTPGYERQYPQRRLACHLLGVVGKDGRGLEGVELLANESLSGERIKTRRYRDGRGREISERLIDPQNLRGANVYLTIDSNLQFIAEQEIEKVWKESRAKKVMVVVQDPQTGEILAMASRPNFDPGDYSSSAVSLRNPAVSDVFEPGSTFKLITAAAVLEERAVKPSEVIWCEDGKYQLFGHTISDHEQKGFLTLAQIIGYSSNIGVAKLGQRLGKDTLYRYIRQFGFNSLTGIDLPGEAKGLLKRPESWSGLSLPIISFGQEIGVTALQVTNAYSAIANGGMLLEPRVIRGITNGGGDGVDAVAGIGEMPAQKRVIRRVCSPDVAARLREMLGGVVEAGTGQTARVSGYSVGGKTGTAQKRDPRTGRYSPSAYVASFCGVIPLSHPRLTIYVAIDEPQGDYWGSSRAAPVFARIAARAMQHLKIDPDREPIRLAGGKNFKRQ
jgi:cell division protein FtsI (penicillin-binding protein 3)